MLGALYLSPVEVHAETTQLRVMSFFCRLVAFIFYIFACFADL